MPEKNNACFMHAKRMKCLLAIWRHATLPRREAGMELRLLRYFLAIAREGSITRAAKSTMGTLVTLLI